MNPVDLIGKIVEISQSNLDTGARITSVLNIIGRELRFEDVVLFTYDRDKKLTCRFHNDQSSLFDLLTPYRSLIGEGIIGSVAQKRIPQYFTIREIPPRLGCLFYSQLDDIIDLYKVFAFVPITDDSYLYGVLVLISSARDSISDSEKILCSIASRELGGIIRINQLIVSTKKRISELATLSELGKLLSSNSEPSGILNSVALIIARALSADLVSLQLAPDPPRGQGQRSGLRADGTPKDRQTGVKGKRYTYGSIPGTVAEKIAEAEQTVLSSGQEIALSLPVCRDQKAAHLFHMATVPIFARDTILGTISVCRRTMAEDPDLNGDQRYLILNIAAYISSGLENMLLNLRIKQVVKELNDAQKRIVDQEKFKSLGEMTANIAHEIKNPLVIIGGFAKRLARKMQLDQTETRYTAIIVQEVARLETILDEVLDYVKENPASTESCDVNQCLEETFHLFESDGTWQHVTIERQLGTFLPPVRCEFQQLRQVLINLFVNAHEAMNGLGTISVTTEEILTGTNESEVVISISDTGGGIDPAIMDNIFNPFFTTKDRGTGLGLAISNKIVVNHGGRMDVRNMPGRGATFILSFPAADNNLKEGSP